MAGPVDSVEGTVLLREVTGEHFDRITLLSPGSGLLPFLQRRSRKSIPGGTLDLFDRIVATLEHKEAGSLRFSREICLLRRRSGLSRHYEGLREACRFARLLLANPVHEDSRQAVDALFDQAIEAWERGDRADIVGLKALFVFARTEGYPVREDWRRRLGDDDRATTARLLNQPTGSLDVEPRTVDSIRRDLEHYLQHFTEIRIDLQ